MFLLYWGGGGGYKYIQADITAKLYSHIENRGTSQAAKSLRWRGPSDCSFFSWRRGRTAQLHALHRCCCGCWPQAGAQGRAGETYTNISVYLTGYNRSILQTHTDRPSLCDGEGHLIVQCLDDEGKDGGGKRCLRSLSIDTVTGQLRVVDQGTKSGWAVGENSSGYNRYLY